MGVGPCQLPGGEQSGGGVGGGEGDEGAGGGSGPSSVAWQTAKSLVGWGWGRRSGVDRWGQITGDPVGQYEDSGFMARAPSSEVQS